MATKVWGVCLALMLVLVSAGVRPVQANHLRVGANAKATANLNLRSGPSTGHRILRTIPSGGTVYVRSIVSGTHWYAVTYDGTRGYATGNYLTQSSGTSGGGSSATGQAIANTASSKVGSPYVWATQGPNTFDCSGFTYWVYRQHGISMPRATIDQAYSGYAVSRSNLRPGDLLVFQNTYKPGISHVGIYVGNGYMVHASNPTVDTIRSNIDTSYYREHWWGARRFTK